MTIFRTPTLDTLPVEVIRKVASCSHCRTVLSVTRVNKKLFEACNGWTTFRDLILDKLGMRDSKWDYGFLLSSRLEIQLWEKRALAASEAQEHDNFHPIPPNPNFDVLCRMVYSIPDNLDTCQAIKFSLTASTISLLSGLPPASLLDTSMDNSGRKPFFPYGDHSPQVPIWDILPLTALNFGVRSILAALRYGRLCGPPRSEGKKCRINRFGQSLPARSYRRLRRVLRGSLRDVVGEQRRCELPLWAAKLSSTSGPDFVHSSSTEPPRISANQNGPTNSGKGVTFRDPTSRFSHTKLATNLGYRIPESTGIFATELGAALEQADEGIQKKSTFLLDHCRTVPDAS
ncbi:hypothetical protein K469DRAFT_807432 [Zopfia rhizophila CBS 207.26]|uniref:F-box domain-containing protein n=1 Tax=Zopfia rhizophila CBS 207.26 TaxID=1314779 RepID=A0A6A6DHV0_9PEZI|nr:hypothetical protein K469DRAFT_807432 [Zopfia rhizophila CBS 207.26]